MYSTALWLWDMLRHDTDQDKTEPALLKGPFSFYICERPQLLLMSQVRRVKLVSPNSFCTVRTFLGLLSGPVRTKPCR